MNKVQALFQKHKNILLYLFFGALTTLVDYLVYFPMFNLCRLSAGVSNIIAWAVSVVFAYFTNKLFVFKSLDWSNKTVIPEMLKFIGCRFGSGLLETLLIVFSVDLFMHDGNIMKLLSSVIVVVLNYIASKWLVFRK